MSSTCGSLDQSKHCNKYKIKEDQRFCFSQHVDDGLIKQVVYRLRCTVTSAQYQFRSV